MKKLLALGLGLALLLLLLARLQTPDESTQAFTRAPATAKPDAVAEESLDTTVPPALPAEAPPRAREPAAGRELTVVVLAEDGDVPVAGASVFLLDFDRIGEERLREAAGRSVDPLAVFRRLGAVETTGASGSAALAWSGGPAAVRVEKGSLVGMAQVTGVENDTFTLRLASDTTTVLVVADDGAPRAGVPVEICAEFEQELAVLFVRESTAPDGSLHVEDPGKALQVRGADGEIPAFFVRLGVPGVGRQALPLDPQREAVLRLGPTGSVAVRVIDETGRPSVANGSVELSVPGAAWTGSEPSLRAELVEGSARFPWVGLDLALRATTTLAQRGVSASVEGRGPARPGEESVLEIVLSERPALAGRALDPAGQPLADAALYVMLQDANRKELQRTELRTDGTGRFRCELEKEAREASSLRLLLLRYRNGWDRRAEAAIEPVPNHGTQELGDLRLEAIASGVAGRCIDPNGKPVANVWVDGQLDAWKRSFRDETDRQGRFELSGLLPEEVALSIDSEEWVLLGPETARRGAEDLELTLARGGSIAGSVLAQDADDLAGLTLMVVDAERFGPDETVGSAWTRWPRVQEDGTFLAGGLAAGTYHCSLRRSGVVFLTVRDVRVELGVTTRDPRLQNLDVGTLVRDVTLHVTNEAGDPMSFAATIVRDGKGRGGGNGRDGEITLQLPQGEEVLVVLRQSGYAPAILENPRDGQQVVLRQGLEVKLRSDDRLELDRGDDKVRLSLVRVDTDSRLPARTFEVSLPSGIARGETVTVRFPAPGHYRMHRSIQRSTGGGAMLMASTSEALSQEILFEVREEDAGRILQVALPQTAFD